MNRRRVGEQKARGRLERNTGVFRLRPGLSAPGAVALPAAVALVEADWTRQVTAQTIGTQAIDNYTEDLSGFVAVLAQQGIETLAEITPNMVYAWCTMPLPSGEESARNSWSRRRSSVRGFFETCRCLGLSDHNPAKAVEFPDRPSRYVNAFNDAAIRQLKHVSRSALGDTRLPCALAITLCSATPRELAHVTVADVDLPNDRIWLHSGGYRARERWVPFTDEWCKQAIVDRIEALRTNPADPTNDPGSDADALLVYLPRAANPTAKRQSEAMSTLITRLLQDARVHEKSKTRGESLREWLAAKVFDQTGSIEQVALRLGLASLDSAAHIVGHDWLNDSGIDLTPPTHRQRATQQETQGETEQETVHGSGA